MLVHVSGNGHPEELMTSAFSHGTFGIAGGVDECVDGPADGDNESHDIEDGLDMTVYVNAIGSY